MKAEINDVIKCKGIARKIARIVSQFEDDGYWMIEGYDSKGNVFYWKQRWDSGNLYSENGELKKALTTEEKYGKH